MEKLLIVDGSNLLFQMFYGMPSRIFNKNGKPIHGTLGFVGAVLKILRITKPTHALVLFDGETCNPRKEINEEYKANRPNFSQMPEEETPFSQLPDIFVALREMKIPFAETTACETDDIIAAYAYTYGKDMEIIISSFDSDFFQLIDKHTRVLRYRGDRTILCDEDYIRNTLGILPTQYADYKSLTGDNADNIKGVKGIGPKTAATLIQNYGNLQGVLSHAEEINKPSVRNAICAAKERLLLNFQLIKLQPTAEMPFTLSGLTYTPLSMTTKEILIKTGIL